MNYQQKSSLHLKEDRWEIIDKMGVLLDKPEKDFDQKEWEKLQRELCKVEFALAREIDIDEIRLQNAENKASGLRRGNRMGEIQDATLNPVQGIDSFWAKAARAIYTGETRSLTNATAADLLQNPTLSDRVLFDTFANNPLQNLGMQVISAKNFTKWPRVTALPTAYWVSPNTGTFTASDPTIGSVDVSLKNCLVKIAVSNNLLRDSSPSVDTMIAGIFQHTINTEIINKVLRGAGTNEWTGLDTYSGLATSVSATANPLGSYDDVVDAFQAVMANNMLPENIGVLTSVEVMSQLGKLKDSNNQPLMPPEIIRKSKGFQYSSAVAENYGAGNDLTRAYVGDWSKCVLAVGSKYELRSEHVAADNDQTVFYLVYRSDFQLIQPNAMVLLTDIQNA